MDGGANDDGDSESRVISGGVVTKGPEIECASMNDERRRLGPRDARSCHCLAPARRGCPSSEVGPTSQSARSIQSVAQATRRRRVTVWSTIRTHFGGTKSARDRLDPRYNGGNRGRHRPFAARPDRATAPMLTPPWGDGRVYPRPRCGRAGRATRRRIPSMQDRPVAQARLGIESHSGAIRGPSTDTGRA